MPGPILAPPPLVGPISTVLGPSPAAANQGVLVRLGQAWAFDPVGCSAGFKINAATFYATLIRVSTAIPTLTGISLNLVTLASANIANSGLALYTGMSTPKGWPAQGTPKLVAQCMGQFGGTDVSSFWTTGQAVGPQEIEFPAPLSIPAGIYTVVVWSSSATTMPTFSRGHSQPNIVNGGTLGLRFASDTADWSGATSVAPATLPGLASGAGTPSNPIWAGLF